jgi:integrase/recombinase XerD
MKNKIISILVKTKEFLTEEQNKLLQIVLEEELIEKKEECTDLIIPNNIYNYIGYYINCKKVKGLSKLSIESYQTHLYRFAKNVDKNIEDITTLDIRKFLALCMKNGLKNSSIEGEISILKTFFGWLMNEEYIRKNPMYQIENIKVDKYIRKALTQREIELMRNTCQDIREQALFEFFFSTGCRLDEVVKLNKSDIDWQTLSLVVCGKGKIERRVYLTPKAEVFLLKYLQSRNDDKSALFVSERNPYDRLGRRAIQRIISNIGKRTTINKSIYCHLIRHSFATTILRNGGDLAEVQRMLGHSSPVTTQIYAQLNDEIIQQSHKKHIA